MRTRTASPATIRSRISTGLLILAALAVFYVLSSGPALRWIVEMPMGRMRYAAIGCYLPVWQRSYYDFEGTSVGRMYHQYLEWWNENPHLSAEVAVFCYTQEYVAGPQPPGSPKPEFNFHILQAP